MCGGGGDSEKRHNDVSRSKYGYVTLPLKVPGLRLVMLSFYSFLFYFYFFLNFFPSIRFSLSIVAVLVSVRHLEVGVKNNHPDRSVSSKMERTSCHSRSVLPLRLANAREF